MQMTADELLHPPHLSDAEVDQFLDQGFLLLGRVAEPSVIDALGVRMNEIMLGKGERYPDMMMSVCPSETGSWDHPATQQTAGFKYATLGYRKIQDLEQDPLFLGYLQSPLFRDITAKLIGEQVGLVRAMYFAKPAASQGKRIDWHQDASVGRGVGSVTVWTALDETTPENVRARPATDQ